MLRRVAVVVVVLFVLFGAPSGWRRAQAGQDFTAMTNADRASNRLQTLSTAGDLQSLAQQRADEMARTGRLAHTSNLGSKVSGWQRLGENVGRGPTLQDIETAFMNSPNHRANILDPDFSQVGVGVTLDANKQYLYVAVIFRQPSSAAAASTPAPPPAPAPAPRAAPAPRPKLTTTSAPPTTTTTLAPTTTTTAPPPAPVPAPPAEATPAPAETTTTARRPITENRDFLAANFADRTVPRSAAAAVPLRDGSLPVVLTGTVGLLAVSGGTHTALRRRARRRPRPRVPHGR